MKGLAVWCWGAAYPGLLGGTYSGVRWFTTFERNQQATDESRSFGVFESQRGR